MTKVCERRLRQHRTPFPQSGMTMPAPGSLSQATFQAPISAATHATGAAQIHVASIPLAGLRNLAVPTGQSGPNEWVATQNGRAHVISVSGIANSLLGALSDDRQSIRSDDSRTWPLGDADDVQFLKAPSERGPLDGRATIRSGNSSIWPLRAADDADFVRHPEPRSNWPLGPATVFKLRDPTPF